MNTHTLLVEAAIRQRLAQCFPVGVPRHTMVLFTILRGAAS